MIDIFKYQNVIDYLEAVFQALKARNPRYSLRSWCKKLGLKEAGSLSLVLNRKRPVSKKLAAALKEVLCKTLDEREYFDVITAAANAIDEQTQTFYRKIAADFRVAKGPALSRMEHFEVFKGWYHFVMLEMTRLKDFSEDVEWIAKRLGGLVSKHDIRTALVRLLQLGYLVRLPNGKLERSEPHLHTSSDIPNVALRNLHKEFAQMGFNAIDHQTIAQRDISGFHTTTSLAKIPEAKKMIAQFRKELMAFLDEPQGDTVYQVNIQMFDLLSQSK